MSSDWIARLADDERKRDDVRLRAAATADRMAVLGRVHGRRLIDELRASVTHDIELFRREFPTDRTRVVVIGDVRPDGGFVVGKAEYPAVSLDVMPQTETAVIRCRYRFTTNNGIPAREAEEDFALAGDREESLQLKHQGTGQVFASIDALSEYLLAPVFTGRPRYVC
jgi:hypothetical protein